MFYDFFSRNEYTYKIGVLLLLYTYQEPLNVILMRFMRMITFSVDYFITVTRSYLFPVVLHKLRLLTDQVSSWDNEKRGREA